MGIRSAPVAVKPVRTRRLLIGASVAWAVLSTPVVATAQRQAFVEAVAKLAEITEGIYGDEGAQVGPALEAMSRALDAWDRERALEPARGAQAMRGLEEAARGTPLVPLAAYRRGFEQLAGGELRSAIEEFRRAASTDPLVKGPLDGSSEAHRVQGLVYFAQSELDKS